MRYVLLLAVLFLVPSCTVIESIKNTAKKTAELADKTSDLAEKATIILEGAKTVLADTTAKVGAMVETAKGVLTEHKAKADTDGDGKTSSSEWLAYLATFLGIGGGAVAEARRRVGVRNAESDARKSAAEARIDVLEKALEKAAS